LGDIGFIAFVISWNLPVKKRALFKHNTIPFNLHAIPSFLEPDREFYSWLQLWCIRLVAMLFCILPVSLYSQIESAICLTAHPHQYGRVDFDIMLTARWRTSPYRAEEVRLDLKLLSPSGTQLTIPAYFDNGKSGGLSAWKIRFTPVETGKYSGTFVLTGDDQEDVGPAISFAAAPSDGNGFLHIGNNWAFRFDSGRYFRGIGENIAWESRSRDDSRFFRDLNESPKFNYEYLLGKLAADGGNFFRTWMCPWNLPLEWKTVGNTNRYADDEADFNASAIVKMDQLVNLTESLDLYMMLTLDNSGDFQGRSWQHNNYNRANGGPATNPEDFFTDPKAKAWYKDRLRYLVARWGYSSHIAAWEFFNEIDNLMYGLPQKIPDPIVTAWHTEMSDYLKSIDPYHHLITTSISHRPVAGLYDIPSLDFNQIHIYGHNGHSNIASFPETLERNSLRYGKPYVIGEYGFEWDWSRNFDDFAGDMDGDFKKGLWLGLFSPTPVLPMSWWWEYFDRRGTTTYIARVRPVLDQMLAAGHGAFITAPCQWHGPPMKVLSVRCGETFFTLLNNNGVAAINGNLSLPLNLSHGYQVSTYDPEHNLTNPLKTLPAGTATVTEISVDPASYLVITVSPP
jgi:Domain of unknown function (DUF5060)/Cellulase (glycosyl hydrolase family 5)